jgi:asparagine synthase (glutamine-hydrolysing)
MIEFRWSALEPYASSDEAREAAARGEFEHLEGEFAAIVCDGKRVLAARSALAGPALWYVVSKDRIALSEQPEPLLKYTERTVEPDSIRDFLTGGLSDPERTFWRGLRRLPPGHVLSATSSSISVRRWFRLPDGETNPAGLRAHLEAAIRARLDPERPTMVHLSGGIDSSALAALAVRMQRPVVLATGRYPGLDCDEGRFIEAARRTLAAPFREWNGSATREPPAPPLAHPWTELQAGDAEAEVALAQSIGARWILTGHGGDELLFERGVFRDLARRGQVARLMREARLAPRYSTRGARFWLRDAVRGLRRPDAASHTQDATWNWLTSPHAAWMRDLQDHALARAGLAYRRPFLDGALARFVLALPWRDRLPSGRMKALLRDAVADLLPAEIIERTEVTTFESAILHHARAARATAVRVLEEGRWRSEPYFSRAEARGLVAKLDGGDPGAAQTLHTVVSVERWLRTIEDPSALG